MGELTLKAYGAVDAKDYIPGAEALPSDGEEAASDDEKDETAADDESEDGWVNVSHSEDEDVDSDDGSDQEEVDGEEGGSDEWESDDGEEEEDGSDVSGDEDDESGSGEEDDVESGSGDEEEEESEEESDDGATIESSRIRRPLSKRDKKKQKRISKDLKRMQKRTESAPEDPTLIEERKAKAAAVSLSRILTDKDFSRIDAAQVKKQLEASKARRKRKIADDLDDSIKR